MSLRRSMTKASSKGRAAISDRSASAATSHRSNGSMRSSTSADKAVAMAAYAEEESSDAE
jgi:hypothetical protein